MSPEERYKELSERCDRLTTQLKSMLQSDWGYKELWDERAEIKREMYALEKQIGKLV